MKKLIFFLNLFIAASSLAQKTENVFIITSDGLRWQDVFSGADSALIFDKTYTKDSNAMVKKFWKETASERRETLFPFMWNKIKNEGQIYGNRWLGNFMDVENIYRFSYPGYNEILTGYADIKINSNDKKDNENVTVLEFLNNKPKYKGKVAAFSTWDCFPYIINEKRSKIPVNSGDEKVVINPSPKEILLNEIMAFSPPAHSERADFVTYFLAKEYVEKNKPKVLFLSFDDTDGWAHAGDYKEYLESAHSFDKYLQDLWNYCQSQPKYKDKTTFIITTDHGRGDIIKSEWTSHGQRIRDAAQIWMAVIGPDTPMMGEVKTKQNLFQNQIAETAAAFLGEKYENGKEIGKAILSTKK